jgi:hypothetical protein
MTTEKHLWDVEHEYSGADQNYFLAMNQHDDYFKEWESWDEYTNSKDFATVKDMPNLNLLYRWDWVPLESEDNWRETEHLKLFWIMPRKGTIGSDTITVTKDDEPQVREFLTRRAEYLKKMWEPLI